MRFKVARQWHLSLGSYQQLRGPDKTLVPGRCRA